MFTYFEFQNSRQDDMACFTVSSFLWAHAYDAWYHLFWQFFFSPSISRTLNTNEVGRMYKMHSRLLLINGKEFYGFYSSLLKDASDWEMRLGMHGALPPRFPKCVVALIEPFVCNFVHLFRLSLCLIKQLLVLS